MTAPGPLAELKELLYRLYAEAGTPTMEGIAAAIARDEALPGSPSKDAVHRIIASPDLPKAQADAVSVAGMLARRAGWDVAAAMERAGDAWMAAQLVQPLGSPITLQDPFALEVRRSISIRGQDTLPVLPVYVEREHDRQLRAVTDAAVAGASHLVTLVGESSTGKTRACWQAVQHLPQSWRIWHPFDPTRPAAALDGVSRVAPRTVIWLNEVQHYLLTPDIDTAERLTAGLRTALCDPRRRPLLVLATVWPQHWSRLTTRPPADQADIFAQQRELLTGIGQHLTIPRAFSPADLQVTEEQAVHDLRLKEALSNASDGEITQFLAGAPELLARYHTAPRAAAALIEVAMDLRRLGHGIALSHGLLAEAVEGYLSDSDRASLSDEWLEAALVYCTALCSGVTGLLVRINHKRHNLPGQSYRLADYLEQHARTTRRTLCPPQSFWDAAARHVTRPADLHALARAAEQRGRLRQAATLYEALAGLGNSTALAELARLRERADDLAGAMRLYRAAAKAADPIAVGALSRVARKSGDFPLAEHHALSAACQGNVSALVELAHLHERLGNASTAEQLARAAADAGDTAVLTHLALRRQKDDDHQASVRLAGYAVDCGNTYGYAILARSHHALGDLDEAEHLARTAAALGDTSALLELAQLREQDRQPHAAERLARLTADAGNTAALIELAEERRQGGNTEDAERLYWDVAKRGETYALVELAELRHLAGDTEMAEQLAHDAAEAGDTAAHAFLARMLEKEGYPDTAEEHARLAADAGDLSGMYDLAVMRSGQPEEAERLALVVAEKGGAHFFTFISRLRRQNNDFAGAEHFARAAANAGDTQALVELAQLRLHGSNVEEAQRLAMVAADTGDTTALADLAQYQAKAGAEKWARFKQYGVEADGHPSQPW